MPDTDSMTDDTASAAELDTPPLTDWRKRTQMTPDERKADDQARQQEMQQRQHADRTKQIKALDDALTEAEALIRPIAAAVALRLADVLSVRALADGEAWRKFTAPWYDEVTGEPEPKVYEFSRFRDFAAYYLDQYGEDGRNRTGLVELLLSYAPDEYMDEYGNRVDWLTAAGVYGDAFKRKSVSDDARKIHHRITKNLEKG